MIKHLFLCAYLLQSPPSTNLSKQVDKQTQVKQDVYTLYTTLNTMYWAAAKECECLLPPGQLQEAKEGLSELVGDILRQDVKAVTGLPAEMQRNPIILFNLRSYARKKARIAIAKDFNLSSSGYNIGKAAITASFFALAPLVHQFIDTHKQPKQTLSTFLSDEILTALRTHTRQSSLQNSSEFYNQALIAIENGSFREQAFASMKARHFSSQKYFYFWVFKQLSQKLDIPEDLHRNIFLYLRMYPYLAHSGFAQIISNIEKNGASS